MGMDSGADNNESSLPLPVDDLYPALSPEKRQEAAENLLRYLRSTIDVCNRLDATAEIPQGGQDEHDNHHSQQP
jgi:hypothetical protein